MTTPLPQTHIHPSPLTTLVPHLLSHLPKSLPLLRRLQFHTSSPSALILATFQPSSSTTTTTTTPPPTPFAAIWADRTRAPETECWLFSTYETLPSPPTPPQREEAKAQCLALLAGVARSPATTPLTVIGSLNESLLWLIGGEGVGGLVAQDVVSRDARGGDGDGTDTDTDNETGTSRNRLGVISGISVPYCKWLIAPPGRAAAGKEEQEHSLPPGYAFGKLGGDDELRLTIARTAIPKTVTTLAQLGNLGVRYIPKASNITATATTTPTPTPAGSETDREKPQGELVAWAFLGVDGSLTSLHVEPAHRGQGLAKAVSRRLFRCLADDALAMGFRPVGGIENGQERGNEAAQEQENSDGTVGQYGNGEGWAHSDVAEANVESAGVARGLGGKEGWRVRWVSVDLAAVAAVVEGG